MDESAEPKLVEIVEEEKPKAQPKETKKQPEQQSM
jgi:hypothetical protein